MALAISSSTLALAIAPLVFAAPASAQDWTIPAGQTLVYDATLGPVVLDNLIIETGATLQIVGHIPFRLTAHQSVRIAGRLDLSGRSNPGVLSFNTTNIPEPGSDGPCGGGRGGTGSFLTTQSTPIGGGGFGAHNSVNGGGRGGESGFNPNSNSAFRRPGGGGGGALAPNQPIDPNPQSPLNIGLIAESGRAGAPQATGAITNVSPPHGGAQGPIPFIDGDRLNDFWGEKLDPSTQTLIHGELPRPLGGSGGGAGGDASQTAVFPMMPFDPTGDEKGSGGGGGGGLGLILARSIVISAGGRIVDNGGNGGGGENTNGFDRIGGGSGGGSGGYLVLEANLFDLSNAGTNCITALGGRGGAGADNVFGAICAGGNGGPGVIQMHTPTGTESDVLLPLGKTLDDMTSPNAHVLLPKLKQ